MSADVTASVHQHALLSAWHGLLLRCHFYVLVLPAGVIVPMRQHALFERCGMFKAAMPPHDFATHLTSQYALIAVVAAVAAKTLKPLRPLPWRPRDIL